MSETWQAARIYSYGLAFKQPLVFSEHTLTKRQGLLLELISPSGHAYWGEAAPLPGFSSETLSQALTQLKQTSPRILKNQSIALELLHPSVAFALSCARNKLKPLFPIQASTLLLQGEPEKIWQYWQQLEQKPLAVKMKVARYKPKEELKLIERLCQDQSPLNLHLDANQGWSLNEALSFTRHLPKDRISYIEEPIKYSTRHKAELKSYFASSQQNYALDESLQGNAYSTEEIKQLSEHGLHMLVIKPSLIGSLEKCSALIKAANTKQVKSYISSSFESDLGLGQLNQLAKELNSGQASGLDTMKYFKHGLYQEELYERGKPDKTRLKLEAQFNI